MPEDSSLVPKSAILQSITTEANGFYGVIVTVASTFLGGSLFFLEKIAGAGTGWPVWLMGIGWISLVAAIGCVAHVRFQNLRSGRMALLEQYEEATIIDRKTEMLSNLSQWLLIFGMAMLVVVGMLNFRKIANNERKEKMNDDNRYGSDSTPLRESIPYGSLKPTAPAPVQQAPAQNTPPPTEPKK